MSAVALPARQRTPEWLRERQRGIGSSDAAVIAGVSPWGDVRALFAEKLGWAAPTVETAPMSWGLRLEDPIAQAWAEKHDRKVRRRRQLLRHPDLPWMLASLDRVVVGERAVLEVKNRRYIDDDWGPSGTDEIPDYVRLQVLHAMAVSGARQGYVVALFAGSELRDYDVPRDEDLLDDLVSLEQAFWRAVEARSLPSELAELGPQPMPLRAGEIEADAEVDELVARYRVLTEQSAEVEKDLDEVKDAIRERLVDVPAARGTRYRISYKPQAERRRVGWEQIAGAFETRLVELGADPAEIATVRDLYTRSEPGIRPLRITFAKEQPDDVPL